MEVGFTPVALLPAHVGFLQVSLAFPAGLFELFFTLRLTTFFKFSVTLFTAVFYRAPLFSSSSVYFPFPSFLSYVGFGPPVLGLGVLGLCLLSSTSTSTLIPLFENPMMPLLV